LPENTAPARGFVLDGPFLLPIQSAASEPLTFTIQDIANGLPTGAAARACRIAGRACRVLVTAWAVAERQREKTSELRDHAPAQSLDCQQSETWTSLVAGALSPPEHVGF
jgi:hypothetical protein